LQKLRHEFRRERRHDRIAIAPQEPHAAGYPISQRECSGFNGPPAAIAAAEPVSIAPDAVSRAGPGGVGDVDQSTSFTVLRLASVLPAALYLSVAGDPAITVGQPASQTCRPSSALIGTAGHSDPSL
jgi:hypothetical protein